MKSKDSNISREELYMGRFSLILLAIICVAIVAIELSVAFNLRFTWTVVREAMWTGAVFWGIVVAGLWVAKGKGKTNTPAVWFELIFTIIAIGSFAGIYYPTFATFALWANAALSVILLVAMILMFPQEWRICAGLPEEKGPE